MAKNTGHGSRHSAASAAGQSRAASPSSGWMKRNTATGAFTQTARKADQQSRDAKRA